MRRGFTLIEIIVAITIISIFVAVIALMLQDIILGVGFSSDTIRALNLARLELSKVNNLSFTDATLEDGDDDTTSNYEGYPYDLRREVDIVAGTSNNLKKVLVTVYGTGTTDQLVKLATYVADVNFGPGSGGSGASTGGDADSLGVSGGSISGYFLQNIPSKKNTLPAVTCY